MDLSSSRGGAFAGDVSIVRSKMEPPRDYDPNLVVADRFEDEGDLLARGKHDLRRASDAIGSRIAAALDGKGGSVVPLKGGRHH